MYDLSWRGRHLSIALTLLLSACAAETQPSGRPVQVKHWGAAWPLTVDAGAVDCLGGDRLVFYHGGTTYALSEAARAWFDPIDALVRDDPERPGTKMDTTPLVAEAQVRCR